MTLTLITGVPGTGKTALVVSMIEEALSNGRIIFTNIVGLKLPHYRIGPVQSWQAGTWLHIDNYIRTSGDKAIPSLTREPDDQEDSGRNWEPNPDVFTSSDGLLMVNVRDSHGNVVGVTPYESHKGAAIFFDEGQNFFRPRPSGSLVPDHVAAFEVHRHQGLDFYILTQRPALIDANVRGLVGRHIALRDGYLGRYKYEWSEVGDIDSKVSRDNAARSKYTLPKHVFELYKSADVHTSTPHAMPFTVKALFFLIPLLIFLVYFAVSSIGARTKPQSIIPDAHASTMIPSDIQHSALAAVSSSPTTPIPPPPETITVPLFAQPSAVDTPQHISACIASETRCRCYTERGVRLMMSNDVCRISAEEITTRFKDTNPREYAHQETGFR